MAIYDASDNILMRFTYADSRLPVAMESSGATYYLAYDQVGSLRLVTDASGNIIKALDYDSFGNIIQDTNPLFDMPFAFSGGLIDVDTGLVRFGFREYCSEIGRWTAKDPILFLGGSSDLYDYCFNDPVNLTDPEGLKGKLGYVKKALKEVHRILGEKLPKGKPGKFGSPQRGTPKKGYRLDPPHDSCPNSPESVDHINYWDYTNGKKGKGGIWGTIPIKESLNSMVLGLATAAEYLDYLDPFSYLSSPDMAPPPGFKEGPFGTWVETTGWGTTPPLSAGNPYSGDSE